MATLTDIAISFAAFTAVALVAELAGAANAGVAFGIGQIAFVAATVFVLLKR